MLLSLCQLYAFSSFPYATDLMFLRIASLSPKTGVIITWRQVISTTHFTIRLLHLPLTVKILDEIFRQVH